MSGYSEKNIERFAGLAGIRKKPTPYIGPTDHNGLWCLWREPADNAVDQALAGRNKLVHLIQDEKPNTYWVLDAGEGIPVGVKSFDDERGRKEKMSTLYVVTGLTHGNGNGQERLWTAPFFFWASCRCCRGGGPWLGGGLSPLLCITKDLAASCSFG
jgi:DNA gyrase/topoisomerase IV subunit B